MKCPFLREAQVKYCRASAFKKMIVRMPEQSENERCSTPEYIHCPAMREMKEEAQDLTHCPSLQESLAQYCAAASVTKYIPYTEPVLTPCGTEKHKYCPLYQAVADPMQKRKAIENSVESSKATSSMEELTVEGIRFRQSLHYSANHMWLDIGQDGYMHIGVDSFLTQVIGKIERLSFVTTAGICRPTVVFTVKGVDLQMIFPNRLLIKSHNVYLRTDPSKISTDPFAAGWLFEVTEIPEGDTERRAPAQKGLVSGGKALGWIKEEVQRMSHFAHHHSQNPGTPGSTMLQDGGTYSHDFLQHLTRDERLNLFHEFFSPWASWR